MGDRQTARPEVDRTQTELPRSGSDGDASRQDTGGDGSIPGYGPLLAPPGAGDGVGEDGARYRRETEHARGGLGRIVRARDRQLRRTVAIKELLRSSAFAESLFVREALITARLQHPGIVPVHEAGRWPSGEPYYVMKLMSGQTLKELIEGCDGLVARLSLLPNVIAVAETIAYAHSERVIHRDLKPANIMVGEYGETVVVDWGLARDHALTAEHEPGPWGAHAPEPTLDAGGYFSVSGKVVGTPAYMAPEQARGDEMDERCDVYALGAVLYELLAGHAPYPGKDPRHVLERVLAGPPVPVDERAAGAPEDLVAIVRKAMARDPAERYPSAVELAEDLRRFQTGQLVSAHNYSTAALVRRWLRRHRSLVSAAAAGLAVLIVVGVLAVRKVVDERNQGWIAHRLTEKQKDELLVLNTRSALAQDPTAALAWLKTVPLDAASYPVARAIADEAIALGVARHAFKHDDWVHSVAFSPDSGTLATVCRDGGLRLWDIATGRGRLLATAESAVTAVAFSPDGRRVATGGQLGELVIWNRDGSVDVQLPSYHRRVSGVAFTRDGERLVVSSDLDDQVWDIATRAQIAASTPGSTVMAYDERTGRVALARDDGHLTVSASDGRGGLAAPSIEVSLGVKMWQIAFTPDGSRLYGFGYDGALRVVDVTPGRGAGEAAPVGAGRVRRLWADGPLCEQPESSPDGRRIVMWCKDNALGVVDLATGKSRLLRGHVEGLWDVAFAPDSQSVASASDDQTVRIWDLATGTARVLRGHTDDVVMMAISPDGRHAATASIDGSARVWRLDSREDVVVVGADEGTMSMHRVGPDKILTASTQEPLRLWDTATWTSRDIGPPVHTEAMWSNFAVSADGTRAALAHDDGVALWDLRSGATRTIAMGRATKLALDLAPDGSELVVAGERGVETWNLRTDVHEVISDAPAVAALYSPEGTEIVLGKKDRIEIWDRARHQLVHTIPRRTAIGGTGYAQDALYSPDGGWLAFPSVGAVTLWNRRTGSLRGLGIGRSRVYGMAFSNDGTYLAATLDDRTVRVWPTRDGPGQVLRGHEDATVSVVFSIDGQFVMSAGHDLTIRVWSVATGEQRVLRGHATPIEKLVVLGDGRVVSLSRAGVVRIWDIYADPTPDPASLAKRIAAETTTEIGDNNRPWTSVH